ncbi:MAG TPA: ABC transporter permease [Candidatus Competibacteraceae bacterium]|nr:ABC transporter permease [Candidatus Competibacteraceae bacterium]
MGISLRNVWHLGLKELASLGRDTVLVALIVYTFTFAVYSVATGANTEVKHAAVAVVDEDRSSLSQRLADALLPPYFHRVERIAANALDPAMDSGRYTFVLHIPPDFEADLRVGRQPALQLNVDATAMSQASIGAGYIERILIRELRAQRPDAGAPLPVTLITRAAFNPNLDTTWFMGVMQLVNNITLLAIVLTGAALIREREHGTLEHLLAMPLKPAEIMLAKVWANALVIVLAALASLYAVVQGVLGTPIPGSVVLFAGASALYLFAVTALGILLATLARSMPQFALLAIPVFITMNLLSGGTTPLDSLPEPLWWLMQLSPSTHYVALAQAILYRGAGLETIWPDLLAVAAGGVVFFLIALTRLRATVAAVQS